MKTKKYDNIKINKIGKGDNKQANNSKFWTYEIVRPVEAEEKDAINIEEPRRTRSMNKV
jgi:hypothetical protein